MSQYYVKDNTESTKKAFNKKITYKRSVANFSQKNVIDFTIGEKALYGRINRKDVPIVMIEKSNLKNIVNSSDPSKTPLQALNFVVDIFDKLCLQFDKCAQTGQIRADSDFLSNLKAHKAYEHPISAYNKYRDSYNSSLAGLFRKNKFEPENFSQFVTYLESIISAVSRDIRFTLPGFIKSIDNSILTTGVAIEIASKVKYSNDDEKIKKFITDPNWDFYVQTCNTYGFMIDMNVPWRIVADLDSSIMRHYSKQYAMGNVTSVLQKAYTPAYRFHYQYFLEDLLGLYNIVKPAQIMKTVICTDGTSKNEYTKPREYSKFTLLEEYSDIFFMNIYLKLRIEEEIPNAPQSKKDRIISNVLGYADAGVPAIIEKFEILINKEFDKIGSFDYIMKERRKIEESDFEDGNSNAISVY
jgi:hypothetical protein